MMGETERVIGDLFERMMGEDENLPTPPAKPELSLRWYTCTVCKQKFRVYGYHIAIQVRTCGEQACIMARAMREVIPPPIICSCPQREFPHDLSIHAELRAESYNPQRRFRWPWSLAQSERVEPSTERKAA